MPVLFGVLFLTAVVLLVLRDGRRDPAQTFDPREAHAAHNMKLRALREEAKRTARPMSERAD